MNNDLRSLNEKSAIQRGICLCDAFPQTCDKRDCVIFSCGCIISVNSKHSEIQPVKFQEVWLAIFLFLASRPVGLDLHALLSVCPANSDLLFRCRCHNVCVSNHS
jgi:hypothetical protein